MGAVFALVPFHGVVPQNSRFDSVLAEAVSVGTFVCSTDTRICDEWLMVYLLVYHRDGEGYNVLLAQSRRQMLLHTYNTGLDRERCIERRGPLGLSL